MKTLLLLKNTASRNYLVYSMIPTWESLGIRVIEHVGPRRPPPADLVFLHVDLTVVPPAYAEACARYPAAINARALDISRSRYSSVRLGPDDPYDGPVIVKTVANYGGYPEYLDRRWPARLGGRLRAAADRMRYGPATFPYPPDDPRWERVEKMKPLQYPIFPSARKVPAGVWRNPRLHAERFLPELEGDVYYLRTWSFLGSAESTSRYGSRHPVVKRRGRVTDNQPIEVPSILRTWRANLGLEYGRFDYVLHQGEVVLLDANKTIGGATDASAANAARRAERARGILDFLV